MNKTYIIVARDDFGNLKPSRRPFKHDTLLAASIEASRLARENPNLDFVVFQAQVAVGRLRSLGAPRGSNSQPKVNDQIHQRH